MKLLKLLNSFATNFLLETVVIATVKVVDLKPFYLIFTIRVEEKMFEVPTINSITIWICWIFEFVEFSKQSWLNVTDWVTLSLFKIQSKLFCVPDSCKSLYIEFFQRICLHLFTAMQSNIYFYHVFMSSYFTWLANDKHRLYWCSTRCSGTERLELHLISIDYNMTRDQNSIFRVGRVQWLDSACRRRTARSWTGSADVDSMVIYPYLCWWAYCRFAWGRSRRNDAKNQINDLKWPHQTICGLL